MKNLPIAVLITTLVSFAGQFWLSGRVRALDPPWVQPSETRFRGSNPAIYGIMTFGQLPAAVDWHLIRSLITDPSTVPVAKGTHPSGYYDLDLASDLDPSFFQLYVLGANALAVLRSDGPGAAHARLILTRGARPGRGSPLDSRLHAYIRPTLRSGLPSRGPGRG